MERIALGHVRLGALHRNHWSKLRGSRIAPTSEVNMKPVPARTCVPRPAGSTDRYQIDGRSLLSGRAALPDFAPCGVVGARPGRPVARDGWFGSVGPGDLAHQQGLDLGLAQMVTSPSYALLDVLPARRQHFSLRRPAWRRCGPLRVVRLGLRDRWARFSGPLGCSATIRCRRAASVGAQPDLHWCTSGAARRYVALPVTPAASVCARRRRRIPPVRGLL